MKISEVTKKTTTNDKGDCFIVSGKFIMNNNLPDMKLVHAMVTGQGNIKGIRYEHAWVEIGDVVIDQSNGNNIIMRKEQYYKLGKVKEKPGEYASYDKQQALLMFTEHRTYGPWDLK